LKRILVIRGGAIGDFILTLPALKRLREAHPAAHIEVLGYKHIAALAEKRFYVEAVRSIEAGPLSGFFARSAPLAPELRDYFAGFDLIISYLYDPDLIFETNLRRCTRARIVRGPARVEQHSHAAAQLARPMEELDLRVSELAAHVYPSTQDRQFAREFLRDLPWPIVALHPGSGSERKNWPLHNWIALGQSIARPIVLVAGEADEAQGTLLHDHWSGRSVRLAKNLPLPQLAAVLERCLFVGHDSGISHLAAAAGAPCVLLFGPTDPAIWSPLNEKVRVLRAQTKRMEDIDLPSVQSAVEALLNSSGPSTSPGRTAEAVTS
jgi:heptosyltransferase-3